MRVNKPVTFYMRDLQAREDTYSEDQPEFCMGGATRMLASDVSQVREKARSQEPARSDYRELKALLEDFGVATTCMPHFETLAEMERWRRKMIGGALEASSDMPCVHESHPPITCLARARETMSEREFTIYLEGLRNKRLQA